VQEEEFETITVAQALNHPTWSMGKKITVDSATMMNKGLEVIEAHWLFDIPPEKIEVVIHPQSIVHSMVEFEDGSVKAQLGIPDMRLPIQYALLHPERPASSFKKMDFAVARELTFQPPPMGKFRCLSLAYKALQSGGTAPAVLNASNEAAVQLFLDGRIPFTSIPSLVEESLLTHSPIASPDLDEIIRVDGETRERIIHQFAHMHLS
jgi:1-deoxy-D-xylulose-5-phosphate reductoisomerase